jgi:cell division protein ZapC
MSDWYWFSENSQLMLSMGDQWQCTTAYGAKEIVNLPESKQPFSLQDAECYVTLANSLQNNSHGFSDAKLSHMLINATAAIVFHKPVSPKSWFFDEVECFGSHHRLASVSNQFNVGAVIVLTDESPLVSCMVISDEFQLNFSKSVKQFTVIKLAENRLDPILSGHTAQLTA